MPALGVCFMLGVLYRYQCTEKQKHCVFHLQYNLHIYLIYCLYDCVYSQSALLRSMIPFIYKFVLYTRYWFISWYTYMYRYVCICTVCGEAVFIIKIQYVMFYSYFIWGKLIFFWRSILQASIDSEVNQLFLCQFILELRSNFSGINPFFFLILVWGGGAIISMECDNEIPQLIELVFIRSDTYL